MNSIKEIKELLRQYPHPFWSHIKSYEYIKNTLLYLNTRSKAIQQYLFEDSMNLMMFSLDADNDFSARLFIDGLGEIYQYNINDKDVCGCLVITGIEVQYNLDWK